MASDPRNVRRPEPRARTVVPVVVAAALGAAVGGLALGSPAGQVTWQTGTVTVTGQAATIEAAGWTYGVMGSVPEWIDRSGARHQLSWPDCFAALGGRGGELAFGWAPYRDGGSTGRVVVAVDCR